MRTYLLCLTVCTILVPVCGMSDTGNSDPDLPENSEIIADETARMILALLDGEGRLRTNDGNVIAQPLHLQMNAPATVREQIASRLLLNGVRIVAEPAGYHSLRIEWESENSLVQESDNWIVRKIRSEVFFSWLDPDQEIQKIWKDSFVREDRIPPDKITVVTSSWNPAAFHSQQVFRRYSFIRRIAEPALITGVVAVTVYLLYNVRR